jgi:hypothetical protein
MDKYSTDKYYTFDYWFNLIIDNIIWIILVLIIWFIIKNYQAFFISYKLLKWNRWVMWNEVWTYKADIFLHEFWYKFNWLSKTELDKFYFSHITWKNINLRYELIVKDYIKYNLIELDIHNNKYKSIRNLRNKIIAFIIRNYLIYIVWDKKSHYFHLKHQLNNKN